MRAGKKLTALLVCAALFCGAASGPDPVLKKNEATLAEYKTWLDRLRSEPFLFWSRLDSDRRPHRLFVREGFYRADPFFKEEFVEIFSHYLAGHPDKFILIDIYDARSGAHVGEFGWGGFKLY